MTILKTRTRIGKKSSLLVVSLLAVLASSDFAKITPADAVTWTTISAKLEHYVKNSDRIVTGMVTDRESHADHEDVWISVYEWLKNGDNSDQIILRVEGSTSSRDIDLGIGEEVLLMLTNIDIERGYFGLYHPFFDWPSKYSLSDKEQVVAMVAALSESKTREQKEEEELQRLLNQSGTEHCSIREVQWIDNGRSDKFFYCTYKNEDERFYVPISVTLTHVREELRKHVSDRYIEEHFDLRRAWDEAIVNGKTEPVGQMLEFEYALGNFTFVYYVRISLGYEPDDNTLLYMSYSPPNEFTSSAVRDRSQIDEIIYGSNCLEPGTPYVLYEAATGAHVDRGFSPIIGGRGPPDVFDRHGNQIREADKGFQIWLDTGEIQCTSNVKQSDELNDARARQDRVVVMNASNYLRASESVLLSDASTNVEIQQLSTIIGVGVATAGIIAFLTLRKRK